MTVESLIPERTLRVLNPDRYPQRLERVMEEISRSEILSRIPMSRWRATPVESRVRPSWFRHNKVAHYWAATRDHIDMIENRILLGQPYAVILEDDVQLVPNCDIELEQAITMLSEGWKSLKLSDYKRVPLLACGGMPKMAARSSGWFCTPAAIVKQVGPQRGKGS